MGTDNIGRASMRYYKNIENSYILAIGTGGGGTEITEAEYASVNVSVPSE
jgi:hypothetical protein